MKVSTFTVLILLVLINSVSAQPINKQKADSIEPKQVLINTETIIKLERENAELKVLVQAVKDENDKRTGTILWGVGIIVSLLTVLIAGSAFKANQTAKEAAKEEFDKELSNYKQTFEVLKEEQNKQIQEFREAINAIKLS